MRVDVLWFCGIEYCRCLVGMLPLGGRLVDVCHWFGLNFLGQFVRLVHHYAVVQAQAGAEIFCQHFIEQAHVVALKVFNEEVAGHL